MTAAPDLPTVLVVGGGIDAVPVLRVLRTLGVQVVVADGRPDAPGFRLADAGILAATPDAEAVIEAARAYATRTPICGVVGTARQAAITTAAVASALDLPGMPVAAAVRLADRLAVQARLRAAGLPVPETMALEGPAGLAAALAAHPVPTVVKPVDAWSARGVVRVGPGDDLPWAYRVAAIASPTGRVMAQRFVEGRPLTAVALVVGDEAVLIDVAERAADARARFSPFLIDGGLQGPWALHDPPRAVLGHLTREIVRALELRDTLVTIECAGRGEEFTVVDVHTGLTSGRRCAYEIPLATGIELVRAVVGVALGTRPHPTALVPRWQRAVAERGCFPPPGTVVDIGHVEEAGRLEGVELVDVPVTPGGRIGARTSNLCRAGTVVATGATPAAAAAHAAAAAARLRIVTESRLAPFDPRLH